MADKAPEHAPGFQGIYADFHEKIHRYLARLVGEADSEDVTQEVFLRVNAGLNEFRGDSSLSTWIYRIATNTAIDYRRKQSDTLQTRMADERSAGDPASEMDAVADPGPPQDKQLIRKEMNECIKGIVDGLPESYRTVLILSDLEELTNSEIAGILDISLETVKIRLHRARARLKKELAHHCSFYRDDRNEFACDRKTSPLKFLKK